MRETDNITFYEEEVKADLPDHQRLCLWLRQIAEAEGSSIKTLSYIFCSDDYLLDINRTYLNHDYYTDIITFPYRQGKEVESDIFISIDRVRDNAESYKVPPAQELLRVIAHGLLHLIGYGDKTDVDQHQMTEAENRCLELWQLIQTT